MDEIADGIQDGTLGGTYRRDGTCIAKAFHESDLSDDALQAIATATRTTAARTQGCRVHRVVTKCRSSCPTPTVS